MNVWLPTIRAGSGSDIFTNRLATALEDRGVNATITWFDRYFEFAPGLLKIINPPANTDVIHVNSWSGFAFRRPGKKLIVTVHLCVHDPALLQYKSLLQRIYHDNLIRNYETSSFQCGDCVTAVSNYTSNIVQNIFNIDKPVPVYNGIDTGFFNVQELNVKNKKFTLLFVGNTTRRKGFDLLEPIMDKLGNDFILEYTSGLRKKSHTATGNMINIGQLDQNALVDAYHRCDALLFPSRLEGFGYSVCEAMACGKPVIVSDNSSLSEIIRHGETGLLCKTDDVDAFCNAVKVLSADRDKGREMGKAGREFVVDNFSITKMVRNYIRLYEDQLDNTGRK